MAAAFSHGRPGVDEVPTRVPLRARVLVSTDSERADWEYLAKGGFLIVDDFHFENEWRVFEAAMRKVFRGRIERLAQTHPVFHSFFSIASRDVVTRRLGRTA